MTPYTHKRLHCRTRWDRGVIWTPSSALAFRFHKTDVCPAAVPISPPSVPSHHTPQHPRPAGAAPAGSCAPGSREDPTPFFASLVFSLVSFF